MRSDTAPTFAPPRRAPIRLAGTVGRVAGHATWDRWLAGSESDPARVPARLDALTPAWLGARLGTPVTAITVGDQTSGTSVRGRLQITYAEPTDLPATFFAKTTPTFRTRLANGASGSSVSESGFYTELRPLLELEAPRGYLSVADPRSFRSLHLLEDVVRTRDATFDVAAVTLDRHQAEEVVDLLADLHRTLASIPRPNWLRTYADWWSDAMRIADLRRPTETWLARDAPAELRVQVAEIWPAFLHSIAAHDQSFGTVIHNDVHASNWYLTGAGSLGLCDWQCVCHGDPLHDIAYALATLLEVEDRRSWERELLTRYLDRADSSEPFDGAWLRYRGQLLGALFKWTPTLRAPRGFPEMQPRALAVHMLERIASAMVDLDSVEATFARSGNS